MMTDSMGGTQWENCYWREGDDYRSLHTLMRTKEGNIVAAGPTWMLCISEAGEVLWAQTYVIGNGGGNRVVVPCPDGGFVMAGSGFMRPNGKGQGGWVSKTDAKGQRQWLRQFGSGYTDWLMDATVTPDGRIVSVGQAYADSADVNLCDWNSDGWVVVLDSKGRKLWNHIYGHKNVGMRFLRVWAAPDGELLLSGQLSWPRGSSKQSSENLIMRLSADGDSVWSQRRQDGWIQDLGDTTSGSNLPLGYYDQVMRLEPQRNLPPGAAMFSGGDQIAEHLRSAGYLGRVIGTRTGITPKGYFEAGWVERAPFALYPRNTIEWRLRLKPVPKLRPYVAQRDVVRH
jgi:hypothetical protein